LDGRRRRLIEVALGQVPPDTIIENGVLVDVVTRRFVDGICISISGGRIALISKEMPKAGSKTKLIDAGGAYLAPGLVDAHYHIESSHLSPRRHAQITLPHGTTTLFEGSHEICNPLGLDGVRYLLEEAEGLPQKIFVGLSSATPPTPYETVGAYIGGKEAEEALNWRGSRASTRSWIIRPSSAERSGSTASLKRGSPRVRSSRGMASRPHRRPTPSSQQAYHPPTSPATARRP
jgi:adenine deaminase